MTSTLVRLMLLHQGEKLLGGPTLGLEVIVVGGRGTSVHLRSNRVSLRPGWMGDGAVQCITYHEVDGGPAAEDVGAGDDGLPAIEPLGRPGLVEGGRLRVQLHVPGVDTRAEHPWVVEVVLSTFNEKDGEVVVQIGQPVCTSWSVNRTN